MRKILIVDDDEMLTRMYKRLFSYKNYKVKVVGEGHLALREAKKFKPNIILLDVILPKMNGIQVLAELKANAATKHIPVILITNLGIQEELDNAIIKGADSYIIKSEHMPEDVFRKVEQVIDKNSES